MNTPRKQQQLANAFKAFLAAHAELSAQWTESDFPADFAALYPFNESFDELLPLVDLWVKDAVATLESFHVGWKRYSPEADEVKALEVDIEGNDDEIIGVLISSKSYWIALHKSGKYSTEAIQNSAYGTFDECVKLIETELGEKVN